METSIRFNPDEQKMEFCAKESFATGGNVLLQLRGRLEVPTGKPNGSVQIRKKFFPAKLTLVEVGAKMDLGTRMVTYIVEGKRTMELTSDGLTCLDLKAGIRWKSHFWGPPEGALPTDPEARARMEVSHMMFEFTEDQDLKLKLGYDLVQHRPYAQVRENNWTLNAELKDQGKSFMWNVAYDI